MATAMLIRVKLALHRDEHAFLKCIWVSKKSYQNRKYFNPLVSGPGWFEWWKKLEVENLVELSH